jgi:hypothetical protein
VWGRVLPILLDSLGGVSCRVSFSPLLSLFWWAVRYKWELWSGFTRWLACEQYLVSSVHGQVSIRTCDRSVPVCARWSDLLWFLPGVSWVALQLQLWLVSSSPSEMGQFRVVNCSQSHEVSSVICHIPAMGVWLVAPPLLSAFVLCSAPASGVWFLAPPPFSKVSSVFYSHPAISDRLQFTVYVFQFCWG